MTGLKNGMVMQRNAQNVCEVLLRGDALPRSVSYTGAAAGEAQLEPLADGAMRLTGIPVGGPYTVTADGELFRASAG